ncbi:MAG TPA: AraC family transcriptional regulator [Pyrinomonadaceae bacterium]|jgi:two-component system response regulator YesN
MIVNERHQGEASAPGLLRPIDTRVQKAMTFIEENYQRDLSLERIAGAVHLSIWHLCHLFKAQTDETPARYLKAIRMRHAKILLEDRLLSIKEVMNKVGMRDQSHFAKDFRRAYGLTPSQFRNSLVVGSVEREQVKGAVGG